MKRTLVALVFVLAVHSAPLLAAQPFVFSIPSGWTNLSPGAPPANFEGVPQPLLDDIRSSKYAASAFDFRDQDEYFENFSAVKMPEKLVLSDSLAKVRAEFETAYKRKFGETVRILEADFVPIQGVRTFRIVLEYDLPNVAMRQMQYIMPGGDAAYAIVTYSATQQSFDRYRPVFEESAEKTQGLREPARTSFSAEAVKNFSIDLGQVFFAVLILGLARANALKKSPATRTPPRGAGPPPPMPGRRPVGRP